MPPACSAFGCLRIPKRYPILPFPLSKRTLDRPPFKQVFSNPICTYSTSLFCGRETESFLIFFRQPFPIAKRVRRMSSASACLFPIEISFPPFSLPLHRYPMCTFPERTDANYFVLGENRFALTAEFELYRGKMFWIFSLWSPLLYHDFWICQEAKLKKNKKNCE